MEEVEGCDPKGVGVLTTRRRYSREKHRQRAAFHSLIILGFLCKK
jgi:hypothetical protein